MPDTIPDLGPEVVTVAAGSAEIQIANVVLIHQPANVAAAVPVLVAGKRAVARYRSLQPQRDRETASVDGVLVAKRHGPVARPAPTRIILETGSLTNNSRR